METFTLEPQEAYIIRVYRESARAEQRKIFETSMDISLRREERQRNQRAAQTKPKGEPIHFPVQPR